MSTIGHITIKHKFRRWIFHFLHFATFKNTYYYYDYNSVWHKSQNHWIHSRSHPLLRSRSHMWTNKHTRTLIPNNNATRLDWLKCPSGAIKLNKSTLALKCVPPQIKCKLSLSLALFLFRWCVSHIKGFNYICEYRHGKHLLY